MFTSYMHIAIEEACKAYSKGEVPVGAVIILNNQIISRAHNEVYTTHDPTAHAEILAIRKASKLLATTQLNNCHIYTTLEPCAMCAKAIILSRIRKLYFGVQDIKSGDVEHGCNVMNSLTSHHYTEIYPCIMENITYELMHKFFVKLRQYQQIQKTKNTKN